MTEQEKALWQEMADLTFKKCKEHCYDIGSCCEAGYCDAAKDYAKEQGIILTGNSRRIPFLENGKCVVPPYLRPMCTFHQCKISSLGFDPKDPKWTKEYFKLREKCDLTLQ